MYVKTHLPLLLFLLCIFPCRPVFPGNTDTLFMEDFHNLSAWKPYTFEKIDNHTSYTITELNGKHVLKTSSNNSASAIVLDLEFNVYDYPLMRWKWRADSVYTLGNALEKSGDDYPIRVYVLFSYNPEKAGTLDRIKYGAYKALYGRYPPHSTLNYIWTSKKYQQQVLTNTFTNKAQMIPLEQGRKNLGTWVVEEVDILEDYRRAFGEDPPSMARVAVMNDSDNTGEKAVSYLDFIRIFR